MEPGCRTSPKYTERRRISLGLLFTRIVCRGGDRGIVPLKYLGGGNEGVIIPQSLENVIANCQSERD